MNLKEIKEMVQLMNENGLTEFELEKEGLKVRLKKGATASEIETAILTEARSTQAAAGVKKSQELPPKPEVVPPAAGNVIKSPMVGTFYAAPAPDAPPYVQPGSQVEVGQVICIVEAMKLMNEIKSEVRGKISQILVHNGDPVEFGQPLFLVE